jgi:hypothetical protein
MFSAVRLKAGYSRLQPLDMPQAWAAKEGICQAVVRERKFPKLEKLQR